MEKRISFQQFNSVKQVAKLLDPTFRKINSIKEKMPAVNEKIAAANEKVAALKEKYDAMEKELANNCEQIEALESGIVTITGLHVVDLVQKVVEEATDENGDTKKITKYIPTDIVKFDEDSKEYVITIPDEDTVSGETFE